MLIDTTLAGDPYTSDKCIPRGFPGLPPDGSLRSSHPAECPDRNGVEEVQVLVASGEDGVALAKSAITR